MKLETSLVEAIRRIDNGCRQVRSRLQMNETQRHKGCHEPFGLSGYCFVPTDDAFSYIAHFQQIRHCEERSNLPTESARLVCCFYEAYASVCIKRERLSFFQLPSALADGIRITNGFSQNDGLISFRDTRLTPRWYIKRAMREIASCLAMTANAGGYCNQRLSSFLDYQIENFLTLAMTTEQAVF